MLNFGQIRERHEAIVGMSVPTVVLGQYIDEAQTEIAMQYGKRISTWYAPAIAETVGVTLEDDDTIELNNVDDLPEDNFLYLSYGKEAELIRYKEVVGTELHGVERASNRVSGEWPEGTSVRPWRIADHKFDLPEDFLEILHVRDVHESPMFDYQISEEMKLVFFRNGLFKLLYTPVPVPINHMDTGSIPEVHSVFQHDIVYYCTIKAWEKLAEGIPAEEQKVNNMYSKFRRRLEQKARKLNRNVNQQYEIEYQLW